MKSPWSKRNPWLSMYLSGANAVAGSLRGRAACVAKRQASTMATAAVKQWADIWADALSFPSPKKRKGKRR